MTLKMHFPKNGGETGARIRAGEISLTGYESPSDWPQALRITLNIMLKSENPGFVIWLAPFAVIPNDALLNAGTLISVTDEKVKALMMGFAGSIESVRCDSGLNAISEFNRTAGDVFSVTQLEDADGDIVALVGLKCEAPGDRHYVDEFNSLMEQVPVGITMFSGPDFIVDMANERYLELVDRKRGEFIGRPLLRSLPEVAEAVEGLLRSVYETGVPFIGTEFPVYLVRHGNKERCYFNFNYLPRRNHAGNIDGVIVVAYETTEMVKGKKFLEASENQFRKMIMQSPMGMTIFRGPDFIIEMANDKVTRDIWRVPFEEVAGKSVIEAFPELNDQKYPQLLKKVLDEGIIHEEKESVAYVQGNDGMRKFYLDFQYAPLRDVDDSISGVMITVNDVTEQVYARRLVEERGEAFRMLAESMPQMIWSADTQGLMNYFNRSVFDYTGCTNEELAGLGFANILHPEYREDSLRLWENSVRSGENYYAEHKLLNSKGEYRWHACRAVPVKNADGTIQSWVGSSTDIHAHKELTTELEKQVHARTGELEKINLDLDKMNRELQSFAYISSHDLQEPLRKIQMFSSRILQMDYDRLSDNGRHYFNRMGMAAGRMQMLLDDLLSYSRTSAEDKRTGKVDTGVLFREVTEDLEEELRQKEAVIHSEGLCELQGIDFQLRQLFYNLISNSLKFARHGVPPEIKVVARTVSAAELGRNDYAEYCHISFSDNGIGFDPQYNEKVFGFFQRLNDKEAYLGSGMGLAIVKKIVENHNGYVTAEGNPGFGARFDIYIPLM
jgi:PAS domain S-box-containing protein